MLIGDSLEATRKAILRDLFGSKKKENCTFDNVRLARHPGVQLTEKKIASIAKKYPTIPDEFISYYPKEVALLITLTHNLAVIAVTMRLLLTFQRNWKKKEKKVQHQQTKRNISCSLV